MANTKSKRKEVKPVDEVMDNNKVVEETEKIKKEGTVICKNLNVRKTPSIGSAILKIIPNGTKVEIINEANDLWYKIKVDKIESGYCMKEFINANK